MSDSSAPASSGTESGTTYPPDVLPLLYIRNYTNQQLIDAFFDCANQLNNGDYQELLARAGLDINRLAADREGLNTAPPPSRLPRLSSTEREQIYRGLLRQLQRQAKPGRVNAPDGLNLRAGPGRQHETLASLPFGNELTILSESTQGDATGSNEESWLLVTASEQIGWLFAAFVERTPELKKSSETTRTFNAPLEAATRLYAPDDAPAHVHGAATTWNNYGGLILAECTRLDFDPAVAVAILGVESSGRAFEDNRMIIRFENHLFLNFWGNNHRQLFDQHFTGSSDGSQHRWRRDPNGEWMPCHLNQESEWQIFEFARTFDEKAALYSISMGAAQIMGFNHSAIGYATAQAMFAAFQAVARNQLSALFRFIEVNNLEEAVRTPDFVRFARTYNGSGQEAIYAPRMQRYYDAYCQLAAANPTIDSLIRGRSQRPTAPAPAPDAKRGRQPILSRYWTIVWSYRHLIALGIFLFLIAVGVKGVFGDLIAHFRGLKDSNSSVGNPNSAPRSGSNTGVRPT